MIGLEDRLRSVDGVASIRVELSDDGVDAIKVEVTPGADEAGVLEEIRQVLVTYGLRSRRPGWKLGSRRNAPAIVAEVADADNLYALSDGGLPPVGEIQRDVPIVIPVDRGNGRIPPTDVPRIRVLQGGKGLIISISGEGRQYEASSDVSPIGAAEAMAKVVADFHGIGRPDRVAVVMHELDGERVVTLLVRRGSQVAVEVEVARPLLHDALYLATERALRTLEG
ncbi:MAG: hypothetical protein OEX04_10120 [Acidimicrobiia bacterium]|nr:hypothetical protein [Acidimicrobiia bacterium]MDH5292804.1 hypothetical protein [Acidimicrobiia bacterium]